ncbi:MAG: YkgJ family cysteine cluster protein [bacterium]|nr:YkgJ family cysteine cluster protein [bacterium]
MGSNLCEHCTAVCCHYVALPIDHPDTPRDFEDIRWYLMHENITVFVEDGDWYIQFATRCRSLEADNRCSLYKTRPHICREYKAGDCDYEDGGHDYEHLFTRPEHIEAYTEKWQKERRARRQRSKKRTARRAPAPAS